MKKQKTFKIKINKDTQIPDKRGMEKWEHIIKCETDYVIIFE